MDSISEALRLHKLWTEGNPQGRRADLSGADLSGADISGAYLRRADLSGADLSSAYLSGADLSGADLSGAYLSGADLSGADMSGAHLRRAELRGAYLSGADLRGAYLLPGVNITTGTRAINPIGSRNDTLRVWYTDHGPYLQTGCFLGTRDEFLVAVTKKHGDNQHAQNYRLAVDLLLKLEPEATP